MDAAFCAAHLELAVASNEEAKLIRMYEQHKAITVVFRKLIGGRNWILARVQELQARKDVTKEEVRDLGNEVNKVVLDVNTAIHALSGLDMVPMPNIANGAELADAVFPKGRIEEGSIVMFENGDFNRLMNDLDRAVNHCQRLDQKSIACILAFHRELEEAVVEAR